MDKGDVLISVSTNVSGVDIPAHLRKQEIVDFVLGATPTPKMSANDDGIEAAMRFAGDVYPCHFPWDSVLQMSGHDAVIQFRNNSHAEEAHGSAARKKNVQKKAKPNLRLVK